MAETAQGRLGTYLVKTFNGEAVRSFVPPPLPPDPPLRLGGLQHLLEQANQAIGRLDGVASVLRNQSDVFAIPALNQDVGTFDQMALALHCHMYQLVIVANNGTFGGSNAYVPYKEPYLKQVFHLHGQPQASVAFFEIDDISAFLSRRKSGNGSLQSKPAGTGTFKYPPAGIV